VTGESAKLDGRIEINCRAMLGDVLIAVA